MPQPDLLRPTDQRGLEALADLLGLLVQELLGHLFPGEAKIADLRNHAKADRLAAGKIDRTRVAVVGEPIQHFGNRLMGQVACRYDVWDRSPTFPRDAPALGQVHFEEASVVPTKLMEWVQRLDDTGPVRPAAPGPGGQGQHGHLSCSKGVPPEPAAYLVNALDRGAHIGRPDVLNLHIGRKSVLSKADSPVMQIGPNLLVQFRVEAILSQQFSQGCGTFALIDRLREQPAKQEFGTNPPTCRPAGTHEPAGLPRLFRRM